MESVAVATPTWSRFLYAASERTKEKSVNSMVFLMGSIYNGLDKKYDKFINYAARSLAAWLEAIRIGLRCSCIIYLTVGNVRTIVDHKLISFWRLVTGLLFNGRRSPI